ncbi:MAG: HNH endonuclease signature motif containing protein [Deltaproteobacteria bacterium]|nr:HNH endonuclease signature motif containing protein [Deltaproteobacteria bacterium]
MMLGELSAAAQGAEWVAGLPRSEVGPLLDGLLVRVARGRGAVDVAVGERLGQLQEGERMLRLGYAKLADYGREVLGLAGRTAQAMARLSRELRARPLLAAAVRRGQVTPRKAEVILGVALGRQEAEWVERARRFTVRELAAGAGAQEGPEAWERVVATASPETVARVEEAMELAGRLLGPTSQRWERLEVMCQEFLGAHRGPGWDEPPAGDAATDSLKEALERETHRWAALEEVEPVLAPEVDDEHAPWAIDARLRELAEMRRRWDDLVGQLAHVVRAQGLWSDLGFASFEHYCTERLGLSARTVEQRAWLEARLRRMPRLREALQSGRVSYEKARIVAGVADEGSLERWIWRAEKATCIELHREASNHEVRQTCARGKVAVLVPRHVAFLLQETFWAARRAVGMELTADQCLYWVADHFLGTWQESPEVQVPPGRRVIERDRGYCQVPGCSRGAEHVHHVVYRSQGGGDEPGNLVSICVAHHLHGIHRGWVRVWGRAPDGLRWELGEDPALRADRT